LFNLNRVREAKSGKPVGSPQVGAVKYAWFSQPDFRRAVSMAIDRDAIIKSAFFGDGVKIWGNATPGNTDWYSPDFVHYDYDVAGAKKLLAGLGYKDSDGDGVLEDTKGNPVSFSIKTNSNNNMRVTMMNQVAQDLAAVGIKVIPAPSEFNAMITNLREDFQYDAMLLGLQSGVPPDPPGMGQNFWRPSGLTHYWNIKQPKPETAAEAKMLELLEKNLSSFDRNVQKETYKEMQNTLNEQVFCIYLPVQNVKIPVRNKFGNLSPNIIPHRVLWNIRRVYVKPSA
jgi:peptide/nickel transport system substrate-binding protein